MYSQAWSLAREVADTELRPKLIDAYETLCEIAHAVELDPRDPSNLADVLYEAVVGQIDTLEATAKDADYRADEAEERLEEHLREASDETHKEQIAKLTEERDALQAKLDASAELLDAHADLLAMARRFQSVAEKSGVPVKHARAARARKAG
jgi:type VI protein secretion system component VasF